MQFKINSTDVTVFCTCSCFYFVGSLSNFLIIRLKIGWNELLFKIILTTGYKKGGKNQSGIIEHQI